MRKKIQLLSTIIAFSIIATVPSYAAFEQNENGWKYLKEDVNAYAVSEWINVNGIWYYFDKTGTMQTGWVRTDKKWYYLDPSTGGMKTGWLLSSDGNWYYLDDNTGEMLSKQRTPDGYYVEKNGKYNPDKGNINDDKKGPGANLEVKQLENMLKGARFPKLESFASDNLSTTDWGTDGSIEALNTININIIQDLKDQGITVNGDSVIYIDATSITYAIEGIDKPLLKLVKNGNNYDLYDYANIDKNMEAPLLAMCNLISSEPQKIYNAMYTAAQYDKTIMSSVAYKTFGDSKIKYTISGDGDYFYFSITPK